MNDGSGKLQDDFIGISDGDSLTCVLPPNGGDFWPFGLNPSNSSRSSGGGGGGKDGSGDAGSSGPGNVSGSSKNGSNTAGVVVGIIFGLLAVALVAFFGRRYLLRKMEEKKHFNETREMAQAPYTHKL